MLLPSTNNNPRPNMEKLFFNPSPMTLALYGFWLTALLLGGLYARRNAGKGIITALIAIPCSFFLIPLIICGVGLLIGIPISLLDAELARSVIIKDLVVLLGHGLSFTIWIFWVRATRENTNAHYARSSSINPVDSPRANVFHMKRW